MYDVNLAFKKAELGISAFLKNPRDGRLQVGELIEVLGKFGRVGIIGGMPRDFMLMDDYPNFS